MFEEINIKSKVMTKTESHKTQAMFNNLADLEGIQLETVEKYTYVGKITSMNSNKVKSKKDYP